MRQIHLNDYTECEDSPTTKHQFEEVEYTDYEYDRSTTEMICKFCGIDEKLIPLK